MSLHIKFHSIQAKIPRPKNLLQLRYQSQIKIGTHTYEKNIEVVRSVTFFWGYIVIIQTLPIENHGFMVVELHRL
jgi:hypothetical protein